MTNAVATAGLLGARAEVLVAFAHVSDIAGRPIFTSVTDTQGAPTAERVMGAIAATGMSLPALRTEVGRTLTSAPIHSAAHDVAYAVAILEAHGIVDVTKRSVAFLGQLTTSGAVAPVRGIYPMVRALAANGHAAVVVPAANADEARLVDGIHVYACATLSDVLAVLGVNCHAAPASHQPIRDFSTIRGNHDAVAVAVAAAAGGHHIRLTGALKYADPIIEAMVGLLPDLDDETSEDATVIASLLGTLGRGHITRPPYAAPRDTDTMSSFLGGGARLAKPGAISAAHGGILHLSNAAEFPTSALNTLRQPISSGVIVLHRSFGAVTYPARFILALTTPQCPCAQDECECTTIAKKRYHGRLRQTGQIIGVDATVTSGMRHAPNPSTVQLAAQVAQARAAAAERFSKCSWNLNSQASGRWLHLNTPAAVINALDAAQQKGAISAMQRVQRERAAWTAADLRGATTPSVDDLNLTSH